MMRILWLIGSIVSTAAAVIFFVYLCWSAGTDAQGAIAVFLFFPVVLALGAGGLISAMKFKRELVVLASVVLLPIIVFYISFLGSIAYKPIGFVSQSFLKFISTKFELTTGVSSYEWGRGTRQIHVAARNGDMAVVKNLIGKGVPVDLVNRVGETALFFCVDGNKIDVCRLLLESGANIEHKRIDEKTARDLAELSKKHDLAEFLRTWHAN